MLTKQIHAIKKQTFKPNEILIWNNSQKNILNKSKDKLPLIANCNRNLGVWARFALALNSTSEFICIFDDDTIPGPCWFENCINTIKNFNGLLGTRGIRFMSKRSYSPTEGFGWSSPNEETQQVDIVGHCWFFRRDWLSVFWRELPERNHDFLVGEDIHFSYTLQKYLNLNSYVPPHPIENKEMWGSNPFYAQKLGISSVAIAQRNDAAERFNKIYLFYIKKGFKILSKQKHRKIILGTGLVENTKLRQLIKRKYPLLFKHAKTIITGLEKRGIHI